MRRLCIQLFLLLPFLAAHAQDVVYLKRSEVLPFMLGQQIGAAGSAVMEARQYAAHRAAGYKRLEALRQELAKCGSCGQREQLASQVNELREALFSEDGKMCGAFDAMSDGNPSVAASKKLMGYDEVCDRYFKERSIVTTAAKHMRDKEEFASRVKAGDMTAYAWMGRRVVNTFRDLPVEQRMDMACPYWAEGARRNDRMSIAFLSDECSDKTAKISPRSKSN